MTDTTRDRDVTVLVVDDEPEIVSLYAAWLAESYDVRSATDGEEALAALDESVDVVLLDRRMRGMTGDDVLDAIRDRGVNCRVAIVTAVDPDIDILDMAVDDYLVKPVGGDDLREAVETLLKRRRYGEESREFFQLAAKRAALEGTDGDHADDPEYRALVERMEELRASIDATLDEFGPESYRTAFKELD